MSPTADPLRRARERAALAETRVILQKADAAYARYRCPASGECCQLSTTRREPWLWPSEWLLLSARGVPPERADGGCPFLDASGKRCTAYTERPFGCRTFFCHRIEGPARQPLEEVVALSRRLEAVNQRLDPEVSGPRPLLELARSARGEKGSPA
jgi:hypothetical protein